MRKPETDIYSKLGGIGLRRRAQKAKIRKDQPGAQKLHCTQADDYVQQPYMHFGKRIGQRKMRASGSAIGLLVW